MGVLGDWYTTGVISPLFNAAVKMLSGLWLQMKCVPDRTVHQEESTAAAAPGTDYGVRLKKRQSESQMPPLQESVQ